MENAITIKDIESLIDASTVTDYRIGRKSCIVSVTLPNGHTEIGSWSCIDEKNYNHKHGIQVCLAKAKKNIWELEGYNLQCKLHEKSKFKGPKETNFEVKS